MKVSRKAKVEIAIMSLAVLVGILGYSHGWLGPSVGVGYLAMIVYDTRDDAAGAPADAAKRQEQPRQPGLRHCHATHPVYGVCDQSLGHAARHSRWTPGDGRVWWTT